MKEIYDSTKMENNYTDPKKLGSDGNYTDLRVLLDYGFKIESITPYDMFPHTNHVETLVCLKK